MNLGELYSKETSKPVSVFVDRLEKAATERGFVIHNRQHTAMYDVFASHGIAMDSGFDLNMVQLCKPGKASQSLAKNPERAVLMPKHVMIFTKNNKTQVRFLSFSAQGINSVLDDTEFADSLTATYKMIREIIDESL